MTKWHEKVGFSFYESLWTNWFDEFRKVTQQAFTCLKSTIETPEQCVKSVQS